jgi:hypothetical protein
LLQKIKIALPQLAKQTAQWREMSAGMDQQQLSGWLAEILAWEKDSSEPNPFQSRTTSMFIWVGLVSYINLISLDLSQADVHLKLAQQDAFDLQRVGMSVSTEKGPSAMIYEGLELEELQ